MDLERLDKAIANVLERWEQQRPAAVTDLLPLLDAARAYRDLLANGAEPDYEAAAVALYRSTVGGNADEMEPFGTYASDDIYRTKARLAVDAAVGGRLLVDPPKRRTDE